jgi:Kef-type K+ transport system membrane component KefB
MSSQDFVKLGFQLTTMLALAIFLGEMFRRARQPAVVGEMLGGILLGPTIFGMLAPAMYEWLFLSSPTVGAVRDASTKLGMLFFLFFAGLEVNLSDLKKYGKRAVLIGSIGTLLPIAAGAALVYALPRSFWGAIDERHMFSFALFMGMNLANSANPVIARVLLDLGLLHTPIGTLIMTATIVDDLVNWTVFAIVLSDIAPASAGPSASVGGTALMVILFFVLVLAVGRSVGPRALRWARSNLAWPNGFIALTSLLVLIAASIAEHLGIHAFLGAFLTGVALGGKEDEQQQEANKEIGDFVLSFFAPIYFISMGMTTNFIKNFDPLLTAVVFAAACVSKVGAVLLGEKAAGMPIGREAWAIGFGLNARGATGIILAGVGLANKVIDERIFVAVVVMAMATSLLAGPAMNELLQGRRASSTAAAGRD